jgi:hypothetical protein
MKLKQMVHDQQEAEKKRIGSQELQIILAVCINQNFNERFFFCCFLLETTRTNC